MTERGPVADLATSETDEAWLARTRVFLQPIAAPSVLGLMGFAVATMMVVTTHVVASVPLGHANSALGFWFIALTLMTFSAALAGLAESAMLVVTLGSLTAGSVLSAIGFWAGSLGPIQAGGWLFIVSAAAAWLFATAMMLESSFGRTIIPLGRFTNRHANIPGHMPTRPVGRSAGMPGVRVGQ